MTEREWRLRARIDRLADELAQARREIAEHGRKTKRKARARRMRRCVYCGAITRCESEPFVCSVHKALVELDPEYLSEVG